MMAKLQFKDVVLSAEGQTVLGPVDLSLESPGITVILGPNGAGKSLFLAAAHGLMAPQQGRVEWNGLSAGTSRNCRGFVFQNTPILRRSVAGNIALPLSARNFSKSKKAELLERALGEARLTEHARKPAAALSGGERQRLALARAMVTEPEVVFLDEPASNLDPGFTADLETQLQKIARSGTKILMATHDLAQAQRLADDILFFSGGMLLEQSPANSFFKNPAHAITRNFLKGCL